MADFRISEFQSLVHDFLLGKKAWDDVHRFVIEAEWKNEADFPDQYPHELEELYMAFLADSKDDPQFLLSNDEVQALFDKLQSRLRSGS